ncbi:hypothetical protein [Sphingobium lignivorans]|uniref:Uncharacterized protein n=1 Tax=Sphingobium lignivorans TaxID=2735886 RepID=A0ABR6NFC3_9SPHN|nr:hypothetical protein [Sphingobium lignivorans]MBB5985975.1 hypothetical protein [Sphingobium lignivorans]
MTDHTEAMKRLKSEIAKPQLTERWQRGTDDVFDPWNIFPCFYGSYSSAFDDMAILVLSNMQERKWGSLEGENLAHEMFREVLCTFGFADYGISPRCCFPVGEFEELLPVLLTKWREYAEAEWKND